MYTSDGRLLIAKINYLTYTKEVMFSSLFVVCVVR